VIIVVVGAGGTPAVRELAYDLGIVGLGRSFAGAHLGRGERRRYEENGYGGRFTGGRGAEKCDMPSAKALLLHPRTPAAFSGAMKRSSPRINSGAAS
jgi:hypothetical protein